MAGMAGCLGIRDAGDVAQMRELVANILGVGVGVGAVALIWLGVAILARSVWDTWRR